MSCCCASPPAPCAGRTSSSPRGSRRAAAADRPGSPGRRAGRAWHGPGLARGRPRGRHLARRACGRCARCLEGRENLWQCRVHRLGPRRRLRRAHDGAGRLRRRAARRLDDLAAAPLLCGGVIGYRSLGSAASRPGGRLGLYGFGASARCAIQVARHWGCGVYVCTRSERERSARWSWARPGPAATTSAARAARRRDHLRARRARGGGRAPRRSTAAARWPINAIHLDRIPEFPYDLLWWERSPAQRRQRHARGRPRLHRARAAGSRSRPTPRCTPLDDANLALQQVSTGAVQVAIIVPA